MTSHAHHPHPIISFDKVNKWYGNNFHVLRDIDLHVKRGERIVICGPSGSGKSTLIRCINRLEPHQQGRIVVNGTELTGNLKNIDTVRSTVGMVFQHFNLFPHLTVLENCTLAPIWVRKVPKKEAEETATESAEKQPDQSTSEKMVPLKALIGERREKQELHTKMAEMSAELAELKARAEAKQVLPEVADIDDESVKKLMTEYPEDTFVKTIAALHKKTRLLEGRLEGQEKIVKVQAQSQGEKILNERLSKLKGEHPELKEVWSEDGADTPKLEEFLQYVNEHRLFTEADFYKAFKGHFADDIIASKTASAADEAQKRLEEGRKAGVIGKGSKKPPASGFQPAWNKGREEIVKAVERRLAAKGQL